MILALLHKIVMLVSPLCLLTPVKFRFRLVTYNRVGSGWRDVSDDWAVAMLAPAARTLLLSLLLLDIYLVTATATETEKPMENSNDGVVLNSVNDDQTLQKRNGDGHRGTGAKYENSFIKQMERVKLRF